jgi:hypothetical protein
LKRRIAGSGRVVAHPEITQESLGQVIADN